MKAFSRFAQSYLKKQGFKCIPPELYSQDGYTLYEYRKPDGSFDLDAYRRIQIEGNKRKINQIWAVEENIAFLANYILDYMPSPRFGICHGTRQGLEQQWFRKYLNGCEVIGTEISDNASEFPHTIEWDFHEVKEEWLNAADFIYSNAFDHTYDPEKCLNAWMSCVRPGGICVLEHTRFHGAAVANQLDPFGAELTQMPYLIALWGRGRFCLREFVAAPASKQDSSVWFLVIHKF